MNDPVVVIGATGYTGRLIAEALAKQNAPMILVGRSQAALAMVAESFSPKPEILVADITTEAGADQVLASSPVIINAAGPYFLTSGKLIAKAAQRPGLYLDLTGEQSVVQASVTQHHEQAKASGALIVHSVAFESALGDWLADMVAPMDRHYKDISVYYHVTGSRPSPGTLLTMRTAMHRTSQRWHKGHWHDTLPLTLVRDVPPLMTVEPDHAALFAPYPDPVFFMRRYAVEDAATFLIREESAARTASDYEGREPKPLDEVIAKHQSDPGRGGGQAERLTQQFQIVVKAVDDSESVSLIRLKGYDPYGLSANVAAWFGTHVGRMPMRPVGVRTPSEVVHGEEALEAIRALQTVEWTVRIGG